MQFVDAVTHSGGTITTGSGGLQFDAAFTGTAGPLVGQRGYLLDFQGNTVLGTLTPNGCTVTFSGTAWPQTFDSNGQALPSVTINEGTGNSLQPVNNNVTQRGSQLYIQSGILDLQTHNLGWITDSGTGSPDGGQLHGVNGALKLDVGSELLCGNFTSQTNHTVNNVGANMISASGNVIISGTFQTPPTRPWR